MFSREGGTAALSTKPPVSDRHRGFLVKKREFGVISPGESEALVLSSDKTPGRQRMARQITAPNPPFLTEKGSDWQKRRAALPPGALPQSRTGTPEPPPQYPTPSFCQTSRVSRQKEGVGYRFSRQKTGVWYFDSTKTQVRNERSSLLRYQTPYFCRKKESGRQKRGVWTHRDGRQGALTRSSAHGER